MVLQRKSCPNPPGKPPHLRSPSISTRDVARLHAENNMLLEEEDSTTSCTVMLKGIRMMEFEVLCLDS